ncbi:MAG: molybdopterin-guanine dinucleotide biosynthesis protein B [Deltaproteobacteria bacterium]|nr:molybdopterin-guanine dinucleotide biosynthesis protein B [Deltaproteobacteria bacterium]
MIPIVSIVGKSNSGKTTLIERVVPELAGRGYRVATIKHDVHGFEIDREGKDSWRHRRAGTYMVILSSPKQIALIQDVDRDLSLEELRERFVQDVDIVLSEGFKRDSQPKIEVFREEEHGELMCSVEDNLIAVATDRKVDLPVPCLDMNDGKGVADFIEERFLRQRGGEGISLVVDGRSVSMTPFIKTLFTTTIRAMVSTLKGCHDPRRIRIILE